MVKFLNKATNTVMWVADERKDEYIEAGHKLASASLAKPTEKEEAKPEVKAETRPKKVAKKK
jgi:hypothetical protein